MFFSVKRRCKMTQSNQKQHSPDLDENETDGKEISDNSFPIESDKKQRPPEVDDRRWDVV